MVEYGIGSKNLRKLLSGDDSGLEVGDAGKVSDALIHSIYGSKQRIKLDKILRDQGVFAPFNSKLSTAFRITLPSAESIMSAQTGENVEGYTLENIELEYETIDNQDLAQESSSRGMRMDRMDKLYLTTLTLLAEAGFHNGRVKKTLTEFYK